MLKTPAEELAISTDKASRFASGNPAAARELSPRAAEESKSAWSHPAFSTVAADSGFYAELFESANGERACRELQALALFMFKKRAGAVRSRIEGVSIPRDAFPSGIVLESEDRHIAPRFDPTHRSIRKMTSTALADCFLRIHEKGFAKWKYTRTQFHNLIRYLLERKCLRPEYEAVAQQILQGD